jgi:cobalt/nickel transport system permease protein
VHIHFLDPYHEGRSLIHQLDSRIKLVLALAYILASALTPAGAWPIYIILLAILLGVEVLSEESIGFYFKRSLLALPFVLAAVPLIFTLPGQPLFAWLLGGIQITISLPGLERFLSVLIKSWISVQMAIVLTTTTPFPDFLLALRALRMPRLLVAVIGLMWRYLFVLADEALRLSRARAARSGVSGDRSGKSGDGLIWRAKVTGGMVGNLFLRSFERSDRIYVAMLSRGYDGEVRNLPHPGLSSSSWIIFLIGIFLLAVLTWLGRLGWA